MNLILFTNLLSETTCYHILSPKMMDKSTAGGISIFICLPHVVSRYGVEMQIFTLQVFVIPN